MKKRELNFGLPFLFILMSFYSGKFKIWNQPHFDDPQSLHVRQPS